MIQMIIDVCVLDGLPVESSPAYQAMKELHGQEAADRLVIEWHPPPSEVKAHELAGDCPGGH